LGGLFGFLKIGLVLSIILMVFTNMNKAIPFIQDDDIKKSVLFNPVKSLAPMIFPSIIKEENPQGEVNNSN
jgi:membrane protein required for colicin V production